MPSTGKARLPSLMSRTALRGGLSSQQAATHFRGLDTAIEKAGFSGPRKPEPSREVIGRSELLAKKRSTYNAGPTA